MSAIAAPDLAAEERPASGRLPVLALVLGGAAAVVTVWAVRRSPIAANPVSTAYVKGALVAGYAAVGAFTWWRRPTSRLGPLVAGAGFLLAAVATLTAAEQERPFTLGRVLLAFAVVYLLYLFLCFPRDRLVSAGEQRFIRGFTAISIVVWALVLALAETLPRGGALTDCSGRCPANGFQLVDSPEGVTRGVDLLANAVTALGIAIVLVLLVRKARSPSQLSRRAVTPLVYGILLLGASYVIYSLSAGNVRRTAEFSVFTAVGLIAVPAGLIVGQIRARLLATRRLPQLVRDAGGRPVTTIWIQEMLRESLDDPTLALGVWDPDRGHYIGAENEPLELPQHSAEIAVVEIEQDGSPAIALVHSTSFEEDPAIVEALGTTAAMLLENAKLVQQIQASRERIVESADQERRHLERDLHDGAQQRLLAIQVKLAHAQAQADEGLASELEQVASDVAAAVDELRALAHGIYPAVLSERGLRDALRSAANVAPITVYVVDRGVGRCSSAIEAAVYYCSLEAIQNAAKHSGPGTELTVELGRRNGRLEFALRDNGVGFEPSEVTQGIGLVNMRDRIGAVGGVLHVASAPGSGTTVSGTVPLRATPGP
jgi:signal transduction histidine kinase